MLSCTQPQPQPQAQVPGGGDAISAGMQPRMELRSSGWETLDPQRDGTFEIVHCHGLLHRVLEPTALLRTLRRLAACRGTLLISSMMLRVERRLVSARAGVFALLTAGTGLAGLAGLARS